MKHASDSLPARLRLFCYPPDSAWFDRQGVEGNKTHHERARGGVDEACRAPGGAGPAWRRIPCSLRFDGEGEARVDSDVDLLVDFARPVGLFGFLEVKSYLEHLLGRSVDLVTARALRPEVRDTVLREAVHAV